MQAHAGIFAVATAIAQAPDRCRNFAIDTTPREAEHPVLHPGSGVYFLLDARGVTVLFLSYTHADKPLVEQVALRLRDTFGQNSVFFDAWAIQPGDGLVDKMNEGLAQCRLFLFFVSRNSLQSQMVALEWQNALLKATKGHAKFVPIKMDDCLMPPVLLQSLYIDLFGQGLEVAVRQIVDIASGRNTYQGGPQQFSNLRAYASQEAGVTAVEIHAEHFMEPVSHFLFLFTNKENELAVSCKSAGMCMSGFYKDVRLNNGQVFNGHLLSVESATVPGFPFMAELRPNQGFSVDLKGVLHEKRRGEWASMPLVNGKRASN